MGTTITRQRHETMKDGGAVLVVEFAVREITRPDQAHAFKGELLVALRESGASKMILDCSELTMMVTLAIAALLSARKRLSGSGGELVLSSPGPLLREILAHCGIDRVFTVVESVDDALALG